MRARTKDILVLATVFGCWASSAQACGSCATAQFWKLYPPILIWMWVGLGWFLALSLFSSIAKTRVRFVPRIVASVVLVLVGVAAGILIMGPFSILPFLALALASFLSTLRSKPDRCSSRFRFWVLGIGAISLTAIAGSIVWETVSPTPRTPADMIVRWGGTVPGLVAFTSLEREEPDSIESYRKIVARAKDFAVGRAAKRLAELGDSTLDVPLIIDALERTYADPRASEYYGYAIEEALRKMTGLPLPEGSSADQWREAWAAKQAEELGHEPASEE